MMKRRHALISVIPLVTLALNACTGATPVPTLAPEATPVGHGYLTSVRGLNLYVDRLDHLPGPIRVSAQRLSGDARLVLYQFELEHCGVRLLEGRASVVLDAHAL